MVSYLTNREKNLTTKMNGYLMHSMLSGTVDDISIADRVTLTRLIEEEKIRLAKMKGFSKLITTNPTPLTKVYQHIINIALFINLFHRRFILYKGYMCFTSWLSSSFGVFC